MTIIAVVAVMPGVWYNYDGPLSKYVCEDRRKADDMQPMENENCEVCEDARYKVSQYVRKYSSKICGSPIPIKLIIELTAFVFH